VTGKKIEVWIVNEIGAGGANEDNKTPDVHFLDCTSPLCRYPGASLAGTADANSCAANKFSKLNEMGSVACDDRSYASEIPSVVDEGAQ